jgi:hypothetical protein
MASGGGTSDVGAVRPTMQVMSWDQKTRPMTRSDMIAFCTDEKNYTERDKEVLGNAAMWGPAAIIGSGLLGFQLQRMVGWKSMVKKQPQLAPFIPIFKVSIVGCAISIPFMYIQQWTMEQILALDEEGSMLAFHAKRYMVVQRNQLMFQRQMAREVTKEEQEDLGAASLELRKANAMLGSHGQRGSVDVNAALTQQVLTPPAQTGYKA